MDNSYNPYHPPSPDTLFLESEKYTFNYKELYQFQSGFRTYLADRGYKSGKRLLVVGELSIPVIFIIAACWNLNIPFIPLSPHSFWGYSDEEINRLNVSHAFLNPDVTHSSISGTLLNSQFVDFLIKKGKTNNLVSNPRKNIYENSIFGIFHTSGSSGPPKSVPLKRRQMTLGAEKSAQFLQPDRDKLWLLCLPPYHVGGTAVILRTLIYGCGIYVHESFTPYRIGHLLEKNTRLQAASLVPTMLNRLLAIDDFTTHEEFNAILLGGGPMFPSLIKKARNRQIPVIKSFGMTETCAQITAQPVQNNLSEEALQSVGKLFSPNEAQIRSAEENNQSNNDTGLIWLRGPQVFDGYLSHELNEQAFDRNGWFNTGDYGRLDEEGRLHVEMRRTDQIVSGGENINPLEVESALRQWNLVKEVAVVGLPDEDWGEIVTAFVVVNPGYEGTTYDEMKEFLKGRIPSYKIPKKLKILDSLPKTGIGKIKRETLRSSNS